MYLFRINLNCFCYFFSNIIYYSFIDAIYTIKYKNYLLILRNMINNKISEIIKARKSVFPSQFNGKEIEKNTILELLKNANTAPSHKLTQPWFFKVFSRSSKTRLAKELIKQNKLIQNTQKEDRLLLKFQKSSHIICICMRRDKTKSIPEWEEIAATAMAVQNIWLSCVDSKIGGYWSTPKGIEKLNKFLNLKKNEKCLGLFYLGIYELIKKRKLPRKNIEIETEWID